MERGKFTAEGKPRKRDGIRNTYGKWDLNSTKPLSMGLLKSSVKSESLVEAQNSIWHLLKGAIFKDSKIPGVETGVYGLHFKLERVRNMGLQGGRIKTVNHIVVYVEESLLMRMGREEILASIHIISSILKIPSSGRAGVDCAWDILPPILNYYTIWCEKLPLVKDPTRPKRRMSLMEVMVI